MSSGSITWIIVLIIIICAHAASNPAKPKLRKANPLITDGLFEGDIKLPLRSRGVLKRGDSVRWPSGIVPYEIHSAYGVEQQATILSAMRRLENLVAVNNQQCILFRPRVPSDQYYINIISSAGCWSYVGLVSSFTTGQTVSLEDPGCIYEGLIMHELIHVLGFYHEQSRSDRDSYVRINFENIEPDQKNNFEKYDTTMIDTQNTPYDYGSLMHYGSTDFSKNGLPTIEPLQPGAVIGQRNAPSEIDIQEIRLAYGCSETVTTTTTTTAIPVTSGWVPLHRYSRGVYDHLYTINANEIGTITPGSIGRSGYVFDGDVGKIYDTAGPQPALTVPFYRYVNTLDNQHFYTTYWQEVGTNVPGAAVGNWKLEGIAGYIYLTSQPDTLPLYRYREPSHNTHFYTIDANEIGTTTPEATGAYGYVYESIAGYVVP